MSLGTALSQSDQTKKNQNGQAVRQHCSVGHVRISIFLTDRTVNFDNKN